MAGKYLLATLGCKVNQYESQQIRELMESLGLREARRGEAPDLAVVNTCAVTATAMRKNRQTIRRVSHGGRTSVVVIGCGATAEADRLRRLDGVVAVLGHHTDVCQELRQFVGARWAASMTPETDRAASVSPGTDRGPDVGGKEVGMRLAGPVTIRRTSKPRTPPVALDIISPAPRDVKPKSEFVEQIEGLAGHHRALLKVQDGCDAFCTYCIIPQLRPVLRSKPVEVAVAEATRLVQNGYREIIVTGIFLGAYGRDTAIRRRFAAVRSPLAKLVRALAAVKGLARLRLSSLEPGDVDDDLLDAFAECPTCVPHLHLPLQSGSADILRRMNRQYTREQFVGMVENVRHRLDSPAISTDIIAGFPGESERDFADTLELARYAAFCKIHAFPFSPREKTAAARWQKEFVAPPVVRERMGRLAELERESSLSYRRSLIGRTERVIVEHDESAASALLGEPDRIRHGRADRYIDVHFEADDNVTAGDLVPVRIDRVTPTRTHATLLPRTGACLPLPVLSRAS